MRTLPRSGAPSLELVISDGSADLIAVSSGRSHIPGITPGHLVLLNSACTLLAY